MTVGRLSFLGHKSGGVTNNLCFRAIRIRERGCIDPEYSRVFQSRLSRASLEGRNFLVCLPAVPDK